MFKAWLKSEFDFSDRYGKQAWLGRVITLVGFLMLGFGVNWWAAGGVLLMLWGNNMGMAAGIHKISMLIMDAVGKQLDRKKDKYDF